jgi:hypothetical protein
MSNSKRHKRRIMQNIVILCVDSQLENMQLSLASLFLECNVPTLLPREMYLWLSFCKQQLSVFEAEYVKFTTTVDKYLKFLHMVYKNIILL